VQSAVSICADSALVKCAGMFLPKMKPVAAVLPVIEIIRALRSRQAAIPVRSADTKPVVALVSLRPTSAKTNTGGAGGLLARIMEPAIHTTFQARQRHFRWTAASRSFRPLALV
jgi:hypothetical protein